MQHNLSEPSRFSRKQKIAIPRLDWGPSAPHKNRTPTREERIGRACKLCRKRKVRCSGDVPKCKACEASDSVCIYEQARRDRLREASNLNHSLAALLRDLQGRVDDDDKQKIDAALNDAEDDIMSHDTAPSILSLGKRHRKSSSDGDDQLLERHGEAHVTASAGSNENLDHLDEDLMRTRESRDTGYVGQNSEVQWLRSVQRQTEHTGAEPHEQHYGPPGSSKNAASARAAAMRERRDTAKEDSRQGSMKHVTDSSFYLDSTDIDVDIMVDPYELPDPDTAEKLFNCYYETVHPAFPLVSHTFEDQFRRYLLSIRCNGAFFVPDKWRAQLNLILAIGAKYSHLNGAEWRGDERDHLIYMTRALQLLGLKNTMMLIAGPDLEIVQATGALAFYFLVIGHVSRAWIMIGVSLRLALSLGLHLRNEDPGAEQSRKVTLVQAWWSLHSIECLISSITGRPPVISNEDCTVPLPYNILGKHQDSPTSGQASQSSNPRSPNTGKSSTASQSSRFFTANLSQYRIGHIENSLILQKTLLNLYSPRTAAKSWEFVQIKIKELLNELEKWAQSTSIWDHNKGIQKNASDFERDQFLLKIEYWSLKMLITRPCLCRLDGRIRNESEASQSFNAKTGQLCVEAAVEMASLFGPEPDLGFIYANGPWWALVHVIMQAMAVLLLELAYEKEKSKDEDKNLAKSIKRLIRWLRAMQNDDPVAANAYKVVQKILNSCAPSLQEEAAYLLADDYKHVSKASNRQSPPTRRFTQDPPPLGIPADQRYAGMGYSNTNTAGVWQQSQVVDPWTGQIGGLNTAPTMIQPSSALFGNPFYTDFDQGGPIVNMGDIWANPELGNESLDMAFAYQNPAQDDNEPELYSPPYTQGN